MILPPNSIDLVIFDCDGVLIDSEVISAKVIVDMLANQGVLIDLDYVYNNFLGRQFSCVGQKVADNFCINLPTTFESDYRSELLLAFEKELSITSGIDTVLSNLGVQHCVATSSSPQRTKAALNVVGLDKHFKENVFTASEVKNGKPAPDLFLYVAGQMQVEPSNCLVIEDSVMGVTAAVSAGMNVWRYTGAGHFNKTVSNSLDQFPNVSIFDSWRNFFEMAPSLNKINTVIGN